MIEKAKLAKQASAWLGTANDATKNLALRNIAASMRKEKANIISANQKDIEYAKEGKLDSQLIKRLKLDDAKVQEIISYASSVSKLSDPANRVISITELDNGLKLYKRSCPIGVIGFIFESRPDALVQIACLCLKSGNAVILKGGREARITNKVLFGIIKRESENVKGIPPGWIQMLDTRDDVKEMLKLQGYIDLVVPRGSNSFVSYVKENTKIPVLGHSSGICHVYIDSKADIRKAIDISIDSKCQYAAACNAMETLLVHKDISRQFLKEFIMKMLVKGVELRLDDETSRIAESLGIKNDKIKKATEQDWSQEYNNMVLSVRIVKGIDEAINHINKYGSGHSDAIVTEDSNAAKRFTDLVDSSSVMWNASTRFSDGFRYGLGAEIGISTNKIHARGPVGLEGLVIYKYILSGDGHVVSAYSGENPRKFIHRRIR